MKLVRFEGDETPVPSCSIHFLKSWVSIWLILVLSSLVENTILGSTSIPQRLRVANVGAEEATLQGQRHSHCSAELGLRAAGTLAGDEGNLSDPHRFSLFVAEVKFHV